MEVVEVEVVDVDVVVGATVVEVVEVEVVDVDVVVVGATVVEVVEVVVVIGGTVLVVVEVVVVVGATVVVVVEVVVVVGGTVLVVVEVDVVVVGATVVVVVVVVDVVDVVEVVEVEVVDVDVVVVGATVVVVEVVDVVDVVEVEPGVVVVVEVAGTEVVVPPTSPQATTPAASKRTTTITAIGPPPWNLPSRPACRRGAAPSPLTDAAADRRSPVPMSAPSPRIDEAHHADRISLLCLVGVSCSLTPLRRSPATGGSRSEPDRSGGRDRGPAWRCSRVGSRCRGQAWWARSRRPRALESPVRMRGFPIAGHPMGRDDSPEKEVRVSSGMPDWLHPIWKLWALLVAVVVGAAALFIVYFGIPEDGTIGPGEEIVSYPAAEDLPELLAAVRTDAVAADFVGAWSGASMDKPGEGTSTDVFIVEVAAPGGEGWTLHTQGSFPDPSPQDLAGLVIEDGMLTFTLGVRNGEVTVRLGVHAGEEGVLVGEATVLPGYDLADGAYLYLERCREDLPGC
ncbi:MAG: hypothetical protein ABIJ75_08385 [Actinomycetota bacterium]